MRCVNCVFRDKPAGLVVDYIGIAQNLKSALGQYAGHGGEQVGMLYEVLGNQGEPLVGTNQRLDPRPFSFEAFLLARNLILRQVCYFCVGFSSYGAPVPEVAPRNILRPSGNVRSRPLARWEPSFAW